MKIVNTSKSRYAKLDSFGTNEVGISDLFWAPKIRLNSTVSIPHQYKECNRTPRLDNFRKAAGLLKGKYRGIIFDDSDTHKLLEAAVLDRAATNNFAHDKLLKDTIMLMGKVQQKDGYLFTPYILDSKKKKWSKLESDHEIYTAGHMLQAAVAHHRATGTDTYLKIAENWAKGALKYFGPSKHRGTCGHPEAEMALIELYRETGKPEYLKLAEFFLKERGRKPSLFNGNIYLQDHLPVNKQKTVSGHSVRQLYLCCGEADYYAETGDRKILAALKKQWSDFVDHKMYITGGAGSNYDREAFEDQYSLPNKAYAETCASIASFMWNWRMFLLKPSAKYTDTMETVMFNGILSGVSLDGKKYFYANPLEHKNQKGWIVGSNRRTSKHWDGCACCPPNAARFFSYLRGSIYSFAKDSPELFVNFYVAGKSMLSLAGIEVEITQKTNYPWDGEVLININPTLKKRFTVKLRIPSWTTNAKAFFNGKKLTCTKPGSYLAINKIWKTGDSIRLSFPMPAERIISNEMVATNTGCVALKRGPVVYCIESADFGKNNIFNVVLPAGISLTEKHEPGLLGGVTVLSGKAQLKHPEPELYRTKTKENMKVIAFKAIPYFAWANRRPGMMRIWIPER